jgi:predicted DNA binding CopG/RHH family protein
MASPDHDGGSSGGIDYANLTVSAEFRDAVRVAKAKQGLSYEAYLRQHLPDDISETA